MNKPPPMGHNGFTFENRNDIPKDVPRLHFFKCYFGAFLEDMRKLPLADRGYYATAVMTMYENMEGLPADDKQAAMALFIDVRQYRHFKQRMIDLGLLYERPTGRLSNRRFEAEICAYVDDFRRRSDAAQEREAKKKAAASKAGPPAVPLPVLPPVLPPVLAGVPAGYLCDTTEDLSKKHNKINVASNTTTARDDHKKAVRADDLESRSYIEEKEEKNRPKPPPPESDAAPEPLEEGVSPRWVLHLDGSYSGTAFEQFSTTEVRAMAAKWPHLDFPAVLAEADDFLAPEFANQHIPFGHPSRMKRLEGLLVHKNERARALVAHVVAKPERKTPAPGPLADGFEMTERGRVNLVNGVRAEWLERFGGDENRLEIALISMSGNLKVNSHIPYEAQIEAGLARLAGEKLDRDKRYAKAASDSKASKVTADGKAVETKADRMRKIAADMRKQEGNP